MEDFALSFYQLLYFEIPLQQEYHQNKKISQPHLIDGA